MLAFKCGRHFTKFSPLWNQQSRLQSNVGFIGVGNMGNYMVANLLKSGNKVVVYDQAKAAMADVIKNGAVAANSVADLAKQCDKIFTMLPTPDIVSKVYSSPDGIIANSKSGTILMDSSTVGPETPRQLVKLAEAKGLIFLDTPVSGAVPAARAGTLTFLVGGTADQCESVKATLLGMGKNVVHCGPIGAGQVAKICNNMCLAINMISTCETLQLAKRLGLDPKLMTQVLNISSGRSWCSEIYNPVPDVMENVPANTGYKGGFQVQLISKDLSLAQQSATGVKAPLALGAAAYQTYLTMLNNGYFGKDFSAVYEYLEKKGEI
ncbi:3-hydroxyisobutyrate dehydrogenase, mitochondrial [Halotydeus destructor]|nr:3-hydroxyisobutyrate dehydrogenase, mitochondrial [Halotydeus destructor]